ncbi:hypothetical protein CDD82_6792 [Ophiocordyceps australis]|uniref:G-protein coupled receptors family 1 profile domain-containing protein n=1 Tax=Ophiocordyceps australis TaxID=1399860 RepID=A0A2C5ZQR3_9HYPO|nr:hypothetical protein CDD82_6792 [Ophiocordyceps australis]
MPAALDDRNAPLSSSSWLLLSQPPSLSLRFAPPDHGFNNRQLDALRLTSLVIASFSVASTILTMYCLIILLIQSDMLKSIWFVILPTVELVNGPVVSESLICQASGFFLSVGIEACDVAVVLIAIHTALYIFHSGNGLYLYRRPAYAAFVLVPLLLASLAFINKPAFVHTGQYCYLPRHPHWARRALSWIPRYIILATICITYIFTYTYVKILISRFGEAGTWRGEGATPTSSRRERFARNKNRSGMRTSSLPPTPRISYHGLIPPTPPREAGSLERKEAKLSTSTAARTSSSQGDGVGPMEEGSDLTTIRKTLLSPVPENAIKWKIPQFGTHSSFPHDQQPRALSDGNIPSAIMAASRHSAVSEGKASRMHSGASKTHLFMPTSRVPSSSSRQASASSTIRKHSPQPSTPRHFWNRSLAVTATPASQVPSESNIVAMLRRGPGGSDSSGSVLLSPTALESTGLHRTRDKTRRQLRQLFIYPGVYIVVWLVPFVSHVAGDDSSFVLVLASLISLCAQGIADALVFSVLEKPWRHARRNSAAAATSWCLRLWRPGRGVGEVSGASTAVKVGRTREEMLVDSRVATRRREEELAERRLLQLAPPRRQREWWDVHLADLSDSDDYSVDRITV